MAGKREFTERTALDKLFKKRDVVTFKELKQVMVLRSSTYSASHVGNGTLGVLDYLKNHCGYSVRYLKNNLYGKTVIKEFKNSIRDYRNNPNFAIDSFDRWLMGLRLAQ